MTILFFSRLFLPHIGGVETHIREISKILISQGHRVIVITEDTSLEKPNRATRHTSIHGIDVWYMPVGQEERQKKWLIWHWLWQHRSLIEQADIVHCHDVFFWYLPFRFLYPNKKVFTTFHGYEQYPITKKAVLVRKLSEKLSFGNICIGDFIPKWYGTKATFISYGGVTLSNFKYQISNNPKKESALFIGRLDDQTGIITYVKAFELIKKKHPKFELLVVGDGEYKNRLPKIVNAVGSVVHPQKYFKEYRFAFVSRYLSILEAMASKRLVFALYDNPVKEDYLKLAPFAKFICIEATPKALAERLNYVLHHSEIEKKMIDQAYQWVKHQTWDEVVSQYLHLWTKETRKH